MRGAASVIAHTDAETRALVARGRKNDSSEPIKLGNDLLQKSVTRECSGATCGRCGARPPHVAAHLRDLGSAGVSLGVSYSDHENKGARGQGR